jgi:hypothetical protein
MLEILKVIGLNREFPRIARYLEVGLLLALLVLVPLHLRFQEV